MTGFGRGEAHGDGVTVVVEVRSVNHRFLDVNVRAPREWMALEPAVTKAVGGACRRGRVEVFLRREAATSGAQVLVDHDLFAATLEALSSLSEAGFVQLGRPDGALAPDALVAKALGQDGVVAVGNTQVDASAEGPVVQQALGMALDALVAMRTAEGTGLDADLREHLDAMTARVAVVREAVVDLDARHRARLEARMAELVGDRVEPWRLAQEAGLLADKADVSEELARLDSHLAQVREALDDGTPGEPVGRRLEFLVQEMHREVNTLGSKAVDAAARAAVVDMKTHLERLREQAANVE